MLLEPKPILVCLLRYYSSDELAPASRVRLSRPDAAFEEEGPRSKFFCVRFTISWILIDHLLGGKDPLPEP